jgi:signal transduction histidine kinase
MAYRGRNEAGFPVDWVSEGSKSLIGVEAESFVSGGGRLEDLIVPADLERVCDEVHRSVERAQPFHCIYRIRSAGGETRWVSDHGVATSGAQPRIEGFIADVTAVRELEQRVQRAQRLEALGELAGSIAHDFNNALTVVIAGAEATLHSIRQRPDVEAERNLKAALEAASRASSLTRQLLGIARRRPVEASWSQIDVGPWLESCRDTLALTLGSGIALHITASDEEMPVRCDPGQLLQVLLNLAINARAAMRGAGSLHIACGLAEIDALFVEGRDTLAAGNYVSLSVTDTGEGIPKEQLTRVFEPFFTTKSEGTGLGLATVYSIARQHGGLITAYSRLGEGTTFRMYLPTLRSTSAAAHLAPAHAGRILVVEDQDALRNLIVRVLSTHGYEVEEAPDAETAFALIQSGGPPDLLLADVGLPGAQGAELAERVLSRHPGTRVVLMSGYSGPGDSGPILKKPCNVDSLLRAVGGALGG